MIIKQNVTVYQCEFCKKKMFRGHAMENHEEMCFHNPANKRPCFECGNLIKKEATIYFDTFDGEGSRQVNIFYCTHFERYMHTPQNEMKMNDIDLGYETNHPMPLTCEHFTDNLPF
jgi:hypothetical protein